MLDFRSVDDDWAGEDLEAEFGRQTGEVAAEREKTREGNRYCPQRGSDRLHRNWR